MATEQPDLIAAFEFYASQAKKPYITDDQLRDSLSQFLERNDYRRTPYTIHFDGVFRARRETCRNIDHACDVFNHVNQLGVAPDKVATSCRCNPDGHSEFYCSNENGVPVFEVRPEVGQFVALTTFFPIYTPKLDLVLPIIGVKEISHHLGKRDPRDFMVQLLKNDMHYKSEHSRALEIDSILAKLFVTPVSDELDNKHIYRLTTAFYNGLVKYAYAGEHRVNSMIYPSVGSGISGYNIVINKELAKQNLYVGNSVLYQVTNIIPNVMFLRPIKQVDRIDSNGNISWKKAAMNHKLWALETKSRIHHPRLNKFSYKL